MIDAESSVLALAIPSMPTEVLYFMETMDSILLATEFVMLSVIPWE